MIPTAPRTAPNFLGPEFNRFLFALVGTDRYGGQLSVVSALARLDLDAWAEAAALARLPRDAAVTKLSGMLRRYPEIPQIGQESGAVAARLVALLPASAMPIRLPQARPTRWAAFGALGLGVLVAMCLLIGMETGAQAPALPAAAAAHAVPGLAPAPGLP